MFCIAEELSGYVSYLWTTLQQLNKFSILLEIYTIKKSHLAKPYII